MMILISFGNYGEQISHRFSNKVTKTWMDGLSGEPTYLYDFIRIVDSSERFDIFELLCFERKRDFALVFK